MSSSRSLTISFISGYGSSIKRIESRASLHMLRVFGTVSPGTVPMRSFMLCSMISPFLRMPFSRRMSPRSLATTVRPVPGLPTNLILRGCFVSDISFIRIFNCSRTSSVPIISTSSCSGVEVSWCFTIRSPMSFSVISFSSFSSVSFLAAEDLEEFFLLSLLSGSSPSSSVMLCSSFFSTISLTIFPMVFIP